MISSRCSFHPCCSGLLEHYDERRLMLLLDVYASSPSGRLAMQALCGALMAMYICRKSVDVTRLKSRIEALRDTTVWTSDVQKVFMQFIRSRDTDRVSHTINDDLIPRLKKLRPDMLKLDMDASSIDDLQELLSDNPEWNDMLRDSGVADKLKELMKMQEEGADVMMPTFAQLKTFPFFHEPANWFMPFRADHTSITDALGDEAAKIGGLIAAAPFLCDGDKYSFCLALAVAPQAQRRMMLSQINPEALSELEMRQATLDASGDASARDTAAGKYVQGLYRFFKLFRRKGSLPIRLPVRSICLHCRCFEKDLHSPETLSAVGEFYFQRGYYEDASEVLEIRVGSGPVDAQMFQKLGYAYQQTGRLDEALRNYSQAELLNSDSLWTRRRLGAVCRLLGRTEGSPRAFSHCREGPSRRCLYCAQHRALSCGARSPQGGPSTISSRQNSWVRNRSVRCVLWPGHCSLLATLPVPVNTIRVSFPHSLHMPTVSMPDTLPCSTMTCPRLSGFSLCRPTVSTAILPDGSTVSAPRFPLSTPLASTHCFRHSWSTHSSTVIRNFGRHCRIKINFLR